MSPRAGGRGFPDGRRNTTKSGGDDDGAHEDSRDNKPDHGVRRRPPLRSDLRPAQGSSRKYSYVAALVLGVRGAACALGIRGVEDEAFVRGFVLGHRFWFPFRSRWDG